MTQASTPVLPHLANEFYVQFAKVQQHSFHGCTIAVKSIIPQTKQTIWAFLISHKYKCSLLKQKWHVATPVLLLQGKKFLLYEKPRHKKPVQQIH